MKGSIPITEGFGECPHGGKHRPFSRRHLLAGGGAALAAGALSAATVATPAAAASAGNHRLASPAPLPKPIPGGVRLDPADPASLIHWYLPGPTTATSPIIGLQGMGLDVEPSSITDFDGTTAFAVVAGEVESTAGRQLCEFDVRVMEGTYIADDGQTSEAAFAFF